MTAAASNTDDFVIEYQRQSERYKPAVARRYNWLTCPSDFLKPGMMRVSTSP
jgi:hypothetical protein